MSLLVDVFEARSDNYGYLVHDTATRCTAAIDAPEFDAIQTALDRRGWTLTDVFITHHHTDHVEAIAPLKRAYGVTVTGPQQEADKIKGMDVLVSNGDAVRLGETRFDVIATPGHTLGHVVFYDAANGHLFAADALFSLGVGRMLEGTAGPMWEGLKAIRNLPDETLVYCGHEYTVSNAKFALSVDPNNELLRARAAEVDRLRERGAFTIPVTLGQEKEINPFLRADTLEMAKAMGLDGSNAADVFAALRKAKDVS
ncbi:hydroxyacylglutathione hydrolase [Devosia limi DSM 17137]|uniref:Hydroxyacylglutathione hydrolase n=1 Tax=Devosia limi DSM 17137 TaxID=1121477 RepID=A0A0F5LTN6_9HYPH|nr:hydroxyacylglutathione hydrolase [Devosia limi]KKB85703.1 hydroxyacylglutathione hydrolase [Devosia limi DSM 17137]SHF97560.1 hydroxyacylglutathione hydrolase [Devosia limi DSM 17137]